MTHRAPLTLDGLIADLPARPSGPELVRRFVPPPRFATKRFDGYRPDPAFPSQARALERLRAVAADFDRSPRDFLGRIRMAVGRRPRGRGVYLDGGFGIGKTHLLAALWHAAPHPKAYLSFDELVHAVGLLGLRATRDAFSDHRLVAVDEWELDDPGNLRMALAFLRGTLADGACVATTSNTLPDELGRGRFAQKDFRTEIEELADAFTVVGIDGEDYRHRRFEEGLGMAEFVEAGTIGRLRERAGPGTLCVSLDELLEGLERLHPIRYGAVVGRIEAVALEGLRRIEPLPRGLRWVHFIDKLYGAAVPLVASSEAPLGEIFPESYLRGAYAKKFSRCLSRLRELLREGRARAGPSDPSSGFAAERERSAASPATDADSASAGAGGSASESSSGASDLPAPGSRRPVVD